MKPYILTAVIIAAIAMVLNDVIMIETPFWLITDFPPKVSRQNLCFSDKVT